VGGIARGGHLRPVNPAFLKSLKKQPKQHWEGMGGKGFWPLPSIPRREKIGLGNKNGGLVGEKRLKIGSKIESPSVRREWNIS